MQIFTIIKSVIECICSLWFEVYMKEMSLISGRAGKVIPFTPPFDFRIKCRGSILYLASAPKAEVVGLTERRVQRARTKSQELDLKKLDKSSPAVNDETVK